MPLPPSRTWPRLSTGAALTLAVAVALLFALLTGELGFLWDATSWQMGFSVLPQTPSDPYWKTIAIAVLNTLVLAIASLGAATVIGAVIALLSIAGNPAWSRIASAYVQVFRNIPLILQALFWFAVFANMPSPRNAVTFMGIVVSNRGVGLPFPSSAGLSLMTVAVLTAGLGLWWLKRWRPYQRQRTAVVLGATALVTLGLWAWAFRGDPLWAVPALAGFNFSGGLHLPTELMAILMALSLFGSAYIAEIIRGGFTTVPQGIIEAARALALPSWVIEVKVRTPLALRAIILPLGSQYTTLIKATSIGLAIGFTDLFAVTLMSINQSGHTIALLCVMTACFVLLNQVVVSAANALNHAFQLPDSSRR